MAQSLVASASTNSDVLLLGSVTESASKRRRVTLNDVQKELRSIGLSQPVLSLVPKEDVREAPTPTISAKRMGESIVQCESRCKTQRSKRRCIVSNGSDDLPVHLPNDFFKVDMGSSSELAITTRGCGSGGLAILPRRKGSIGFTRASLLTRAPSIAVDPCGCAFLLTPEGLLMADLPKGQRPSVRSMAGSEIEIARIVLSSVGQAMLFSEMGDLVMSVNPLRTHCLTAGNHEDIPADVEPVDELIVLESGACGSQELRCIEVDDEDSTTIAPNTPDTSSVSADDAMEMD